MGKEGKRIRGYRKLCVCLPLLKRLTEGEDEDGKEGKGVKRRTSKCANAITEKKRKRKGRRECSKTFGRRRQRKKESF